MINLSFISDIAIINQLYLSWKDEYLKMYFFA
jgi:hypothetical protein